jgi:hypothetical protein
VNTAAKAAPRNQWLVASARYDRPVRIGDPYPHLCGGVIHSPSGRVVEMWPRDCPPCAAKSPDLLKRKPRKERRAS